MVRHDDQLDLGTRSQHSLNFASQLGYIKLRLCVLGPLGELGALPIIDLGILPSMVEAGR